MPMTTRTWTGEKLIKLKPRGKKALAVPSPRIVTPPCRCMVASVAYSSSQRPHEAHSFLTLCLMHKLSFPVYALLIRVIVHTVLCACGENKDLQYIRVL